MTKVVNIKTSSYEVYIGRGSIWGNPFRIGVDGTRVEVIEKYREYLKHNQFLLLKLNSLRGATLGCYCKPKPCHGDILLEFLEAQDG